MYLGNCFTLEGQLTINKIVHFTSSILDTFGVVEGKGLVKPIRPKLDLRDITIRVFVLTHISLIFNYSTNIRKISDIKKSRGNYFAKKWHFFVKQSPIMDYSIMRCVHTMAI